MSRGRIASRFANLPLCLVGIEAGMATHYVARELVALGHNVKQVLTTHAKSFRQRHKNDFQDAHAVADSACLVPNLSEEGVDPEHRVDENVGGAQLGSRFPGYRGNRINERPARASKKNLRDSASRLASCS